MQLHKIEIARRQIEVALDLYFTGRDPLAVITLAGAAEEILGSLLKREGKPAAMQRVLARMERNSGQAQDFAEFCKNINRIRNALKHARDPGEDDIYISPQEPISMLGRRLAITPRLSSHSHRACFASTLCLKRRQHQMRQPLEPSIEKTSLGKPDAASHFKR